MKRSLKGPLWRQNNVHKTCYLETVLHFITDEEMRLGPYQAPLEPSKT